MDTEIHSKEKEPIKKARQNDLIHRPVFGHFRVAKVKRAYCLCFLQQERCNKFDTPFAVSSFGHVEKRFAWLLVLNSAATAFSANSWQATPDFRVHCPVRGSCGKPHLLCSCLSYLCNTLSLFYINSDCVIVATALLNQLLLCCTASSG